MLCVCVGDVMDVVFSVCIVRHVAIGQVLVYGECECFAMPMLYVCVLCASCGSSQCCILHDLQFVNDGRGCNRRITALYVAMSVSPHPVAVSAFMICSGLCVCTEMLWMCVLYVSFGSKVRPRSFGCIAMGLV